MMSEYSNNSPEGQDTIIHPRPEHTEEKLSPKESKVAKQLTQLLRHARLGSDTQNPGIGPDGFCPLTNIQEHLHLDHELCLRIVAQDKKNRFMMIERDGHVLVRANQGHSIPWIKDNELLTRITNALPVLVHGTSRKAWGHIRSSGSLRRMNRCHIHFTTALPQENRVISGMRISSEIAIYINMSRAMADGIVFYRSANGVILTPDEVPTCYFETMINIRTGDEITL